MGKHTDTNLSSSISSDKRRNSLLWIAGLSTAASVGVHLYLYSEHVALKYGQSTGDSLCNVSALFNCAAVSASRYSEFLGVPMALWGVVVNLALLTLLIWHPFTETEKRPASRRNLLALGGLIAGTSIVMGAISTFVLSRYCPFCIGAYVLSFLTFGTLWFGLAKDKSSPLRASPMALSDFTPLLVVLGIAGFGAIVSSDQSAKSHGAADLGEFVQGKAADWQAAPAVQINTVQPLVKGASPENAKMTIVEFADFRCIHCKHASPSLQAFVSAHSNVRLEFQAWPLDGECNTSIQQANGASCLLARAVYCAEKLKQTGWKAHDYIFETQEKYSSKDVVTTALSDIAAAAGVGPEEMQTCASSDEAKDVISKQAAAGTALNLSGTPSIYVNGKKLGGGQMLPVLLEVHRRIEKP